MRETTPTQAHCDFQDELIDLLELHSPNVSDIEALAIAANLVGKMIALQHGGRYSMKEIVEVVTTNIKAGNAEARAAVFAGANQARN